MASKQSTPVPRDFLCPITREIMRDPVLLIEDGRSYELEAIERWLRDHNSSPMTNKPLSDRRFVTNFNLKNAIEEYCAQQEAILTSNEFFAFNIRPGPIPREWSDKPVLKIRLSLLGGSNVGKTTLANYLKYGTRAHLMNIKATSTVGPDLFFFYLDQLYENKYVITIQLNDIPGMERFESCCDNHFRICHGALLLADSTDIDTIERLQLYWYKQLKLKGNERVESLLICNKIDLFEENCDENYQKIFYQRAGQFASENNMSIYHISATRGDNILVMFKQMILNIIQNESLFGQIIGNDKIEHTITYKKKLTKRKPIVRTLNQEIRALSDSEENLSKNCCSVS